MRRPTAFLVSALFALALLGAGSLAPVAPASAATIAPTTTCNNGVLNAGGQGAVCEVTVINTITPTGGSAVVTVNECTGSAGVPTEACTVTTNSLTEPVTAVDQCNGSINGGGGVLLCSIAVTNNFVGITPDPTVTAATVNQCNDSVTTGTERVCVPDPATTSGATITQCNGSANGGGTSLTCTASGTQSSGLSVLIRQCNDSSNGGGTRTVCNATMTNNILPAATPSPTPVPAPTATASPAPGATAAPTATPRPTAPNTSTGELAAGQSGSELLVVSGLVFLCALSLITVVRRTRST
jgi:hypothetical protein